MMMKKLFSFFTPKDSKMAKNSRKMAQNYQNIDRKLPKNGPKLPKIAYISRTVSPRAKIRPKIAPTE